MNETEMDRRWRNSKTEFFEDFVNRTGGRYTTDSAQAAGHLLAGRLLAADWVGPNTYKMYLERLLPLVGESEVKGPTTL